MGNILRSLHRLSVEETEQSLKDDLPNKLRLANTKGQTVSKRLKAQKAFNHLLQRDCYPAELHAMCNTLTS